MSRHTTRRYRAIPACHKDRLLRDAHDALDDVLREWQATDSPEGLVFAMKAAMVQRDRIAANLNLTERGEG